MWRVPEKPDFGRLPSTFWGLKDEVSPELLDEYLDKITKCIIEGPQLEENCNPIYLDTLRAAYEYSHSNKSLVINLDI